MIIVFDLDGTTIDSSHRQIYDPKTGMLNLVHWKQNSTHELIMRDKLLPLSRTWRMLRKKGHKIVICTSRVLGDSDLLFLQHNSLFADLIFSRPANSRGTPDDLLKVSQLHNWLDLPENRDVPVVMFDDNAMVRTSIRRLGIPVLNPEKLF